MQKQVIFNILSGVLVVAQKIAGMDIIPDEYTALAVAAINAAIRFFYLTKE
jgi:uncharacterized membrane protein